uniref:Uncharacterized protein n=1 Tax=Anguilla anguilla TaxID=7936 RepID=A0A0E9WFN0_ANGAN
MPVNTTFAAEVYAFCSVPSITAPTPLAANHTAQPMLSSSTVSRG